MWLKRRTTFRTLMCHLSGKMPVHRPRWRWVDTTLWHYITLSKGFEFWPEHGRNGQQLGSDRGMVVVATNSKAWCGHWVSQLILIFLIITKNIPNPMTATGSKAPQIFLWILSVWPVSSIFSIIPITKNVKKILRGRSTCILAPQTFFTL